MNSSARTFLEASNMKTGSRNSQSLSIPIAVMVLAFALLACNLGKSPANRTQVPPTSTSGPECLKGVFPGKTTKDELSTAVGYPLMEQTEGDFEYLRYRTSAYGRINSITLQNGIVVQVSVIQAEEEPLAWSTIKAIYGEPVHTAYSDYIQGSMVYAFPAQGRAYIADENLDTVFIQQCFIPMSLENYMSVYGNLLPREDPFTR